MILQEIERISNKDSCLLRFSYEVFNNLYDLIPKLAH